MRKCRIGTAKFFTLLLLLYHTSIKAADIKWDIERIKRLSLSSECKENILGATLQRVLFG